MSLAPEVQGAIVGGAIGIVSATVTAFANYVNLKKRLRSKNRRRLAESYLEKKVEALSTIHTRLTECYVTLGEALKNPSGYSWDRVKTEVHADIDAFEHAIAVGDVYLSAAQESELRATTEEYRSVADKVAILENGRRDMIDDVFDATERAGGTLAEEINAPIRELEGTAAGPAEEAEEVSAERRGAPGESDSSNWAALATQRDRLREFLEVDEDGSVEFLVEVDPPVRALLSIVGRRYAYERDLVDSPTLAESDLLPVFDGSADALSAFEDEAADHLVVDDGEYLVEAEDIEAAIDWAVEYVTDEGNAGGA